MINEKILLDKIIKFRITTTVRLTLYNKIATFLDEGVSIETIFNKLSQAYLQQSPIDARGLMLKSWQKDLVQGMKLHNIMAKWVPTGEAMLIQAGEKSGDLAGAFRNALNTTQAACAMKSSIKSALAYPGILMLMLFGIVYLFSTKAIPTLVATKDPSEWPDSAKPLYTMSEFVKNDWVIAVLGFVAIIFFIKWSLTNLTGPIRVFLDKIPPYSMFKSFQSSIFLISASAMMKSGVPLFESISDLKKMSDNYTAKQLTIILNKMKIGVKNGEAMDSGFLDKETGVDIKIFSQTDNVQQAMEAIGRTSIENSIKRIQAIAAIVNLIVMFMIIGFIGWMYSSFYTLSNSMAN